MSEQAHIKKIVEAALLAAGAPVSLERLEALFLLHEQPGREALLTALEGLREDWGERGLELTRVASGYRFQVRAELAPWVSRLWEERPARYSRALLETLALIAYRQPITRAEIEEIRGVSVSSAIVKTLQEREWVRIVGHRDVPGRPALYATTRQFLDYFSLRSLDELPTLAELRDLDSINAELALGVPGVPSDLPPDGEPTEADAGQTGPAVPERFAAADAAEQSAGAEPAPTDADTLEGLPNQPPTTRPEVPTDRAMADAGREPVAAGEGAQPEAVAETPSRRG
jgi:segregation and condensation protein B